MVDEAHDVPEDGAELMQLLQLLLDEVLREEDAASTSCIWFCASLLAVVE